MFTKKSRYLLAVALVSFGPMARATEGGGSIYSPGAENYTCCAVPPPGLYGLAYGEYYTADSFRGNDGKEVPIPGFGVRATVLVPRVVWIPKQQLLGGSMAFHALLPLVNLNVKAAGASQTKTGIGDATVGAALGWHLSPNLHTLIGIDAFIPTGSYNKNDLANIGRNYWATQAIVGLSYINPRGFNGDLKIMYTFNSINRDTNYRSGQELIIDYTAGYAVGHGWILGVGGYLYQQTTDDRQGGNVVLNNRGRALAIGPSIKYDSGKGWFATLKYEFETDVRNRTEGRALWLKAVVPF
ncbi:SphA family protein [Paraburkholderia phenoliruptrix]|uniref:SphA family protein n=1 Tax=Paraburkholderia phenoliruptrix TaxID=252970 RepID=UPI001C6DE865|nr:transporter [Paraburkholderia phenoliruptrix]MBW9107432.1 transporter [Paraburkholderia phenoliruptrix]MBW9128146.1 transporter [Paraburkholderia ginsengiterrae]